jgi:WhiB family transcriptional regulator, redox-sensing transcriptional regulator
MRQDVLPKITGGTGGMEVTFGGSSPSYVAWNTIIATSQQNRFAPNTHHAADDNYWMGDALCRSVDPNLWYPEKGLAGVAKAKQICDACPVRRECLEYAMKTNEPHGIWGGMSTYERLRLKTRGWRKGDPLPPIKVRDYFSIEAQAS